MANQIENKNKNRFGSITLLQTFFAYWIIIVFFSSIHLYGLYDISGIVYFLVMQGCVAFTFGYIIYYKNLSKYKVNNATHTTKEYILFKWPFFLFLSIAIVLILKQVFLLLPIILHSGMFEARQELQIDDSLVLDGFWNILISYFAKPFVKASIIIFIVNIFNYKVQLRYVLLIIILASIYFFSEGGRAVVMDIFFIFFYLLYTNRKTISKRNKKIMKITIVVIGLLPILVTFERGGQIFFALYTYYCGSLQFLSQALRIQTDYFNDHLYGMACLQGFIKPFTGIFDLIGIGKPQIVQDASDFILNAQGTVYDIAPNCPMNYFYTSFGYAYKDGGIIANFILHLLYGMICKFIEIKTYLKKNNVRWIAIKTTFFYCILYTMSYYHFGMYLHTMTIIYIMFITNKFFSKSVKLVKSK